MHTFLRYIFPGPKLLQFVASTDFQGHSITVISNYCQLTRVLYMISFLLNLATVSWEGSESSDFYT